MTKVKREPPSRIKYEQSHPTVGCRVPKEIYDRLQEIKENEGKSFADILKVGLGILELKAKKDDKAYSRGYNDGYREAELELKVTYICDVCGEPIVVNTTDEKKAIKQYMEDHNWGHKECHEKE
jgi:predicted CopG family antitoxin